MLTLWNVRVILLHATLLTAGIFIGAALMSIFLSFVFGLASLSRHRAISWMSIVYGEVFRGISLVVELFWIFFALPLFGITLSPFLASIIALGLCFGAYGAEIVRVAVKAVPPAQLQAGRALGLSGWSLFYEIVLPQALVTMIPPLGNLMVMVLKATSVTALITVPELSFTTNMLTENYGGNLAIFAAVACLYYALAHIVMWSTTRLEIRLTFVR